MKAFNLIICFLSVFLIVVAESVETSSRGLRRAALTASNVHKTAAARNLNRDKTPSREKSSSKIAAFQARLKASHKADWEASIAREEPTTESP